MAAAATDYFTEVGNPGTATTLSAPGHTIAGTTFNVASTSNWPTTTGAIFAVDTYDVSTGARVPGTYTEWEGVVASSTSITGAVLRYGTDQNYSAGSTTRVYIPVASSYLNRLSQGIRLHANQDGSLITSAVQTALGLGTDSLNGWNALGYTPNTVAYNGNRSYTLTFNSIDLTPTLSAGMRLRSTRTVAAGIQSTSLDGTTQYYSKTSPAGMTFTDDFVTGTWMKLTSYPTSDAIFAGRYTGGNGWLGFISSAGQVTVSAYNGGVGNNSRVTSYQSIPLNKWVHVAVQLDMSAFTATTTTSYVMIDGVDVPVSLARAGTNPTSFAVGTGVFQIGAFDGASGFFPGKLAQTFVTSAKLTQANVKLIYSQGLTTANMATYSIVSAYSFSNSITDLNTTNANNLTANGSAVATNADAPFGNSGKSTTLDYCIISADPTFSTNTTVNVQVPEGCTIPTSGGVSAVVYASQGIPFGFPKAKDKWQIEVLSQSRSTISLPTANTWYNHTTITAPIGAWEWSTEAYPYADRGSGASNVRATFSTANNTASDIWSTATTEAVPTTGHGTTLTKHGFIPSLSVATPYYLNFGTVASSVSNVYVLADLSPTTIRLENAYL